MKAAKIILIAAIAYVGIVVAFESMIGFFQPTAGATLVKQPQKVFWGGYSGYFADPDGHLWEIAHNPYARLDDDGRLVMGGG